MLRSFQLAVVLFVAVCGVAWSAEPMHTKDSLDTVKENVKAGKAVIVDVREQAEWDEGHLKGAILAPRSKLTAEAQAAEIMKKLPKDKILYTHCKGGGRALACGELLQKHGYEVRPLKAGFDKLIEAGFEKAK